MPAGPYALEHGSTRVGRWLRVRRFRLALSFATLEGVLVLVDVIPAWAAILAAVVLVGVYLAAGRSAGLDAVRQVSWIAAASQVCVALVPLLVAVAAVFVLIAVVVLGLVALVALLADRR